jgi:tyrosyl-tRNA synthetase
MDHIDELLTRGIANIIPGKEALATLLRSDKKLHIYIGIDPTSTRIHLGHAFPLRKLQAFAELGHHVTFLIGDFTALIGDTSDKDKERPVLTLEQIEQNFQSYKRQAEKVLDFSLVKVVHNSDWLKKLTFEEIVKLCQHFSVGDFTSRELIRRRMDDGSRVALHEMLYPVMQGYDSYHLDTDVQIGGTDQTFNMQAGRTLQKDLRNKESFVLATEFLIGTDGRKMSKSWGNAIWMEDTPEDMYAKVLAITDEVIIPYFTLTTNLPMNEIHAIEKQLAAGTNPMHIKKMLAYEIVKDLYTEADGKRAADHFERTVQNKELPDEISEVKIGTNEPLSADELLFQSGLVGSKSDAKRVIQQGGAEIDGKKVTDTNELIILKNDMLVKVGKRKIVRIQVT